MGKSSGTYRFLVGSGFPEWPSVRCCGLCSCQCLGVSIARGGRIHCHHICCCSCGIPGHLSASVLTESEHQTEFAATASCSYRTRMSNDVNLILVNGALLGLWIRMSHRLRGLRASSGLTHKPVCTTRAPLASGKTRTMAVESFCAVRLGSHRASQVLSFRPR